MCFNARNPLLPTRGNTRNLTKFFHQVERDNRIFAWEPRGEEWRPELIRDLCAENSLIHCVDPLKSDPVFGDSLYWRLHGKTGYRYQYTDEDLMELEARLNARSHLLGPRYIMFNNVYSRQDAQRFQQRQAALTSQRD